MSADVIQPRKLPEELQPYDDPENFESEYDEERLLADVLEEKPCTDEYESRCVMVFGIPVIGTDRLPKLKNVLGKLFALTNDTYNDYYPLDADGKTKGYCFVEYPSKEIADTAVALLDGHVLDKNHTFSAYNMTEIRNIREPDPNWQPPTAKPYNDVGDLWWWLQNPRCEDQFATMEENSRTSEKMLTIWWNARGQDPYEVEVTKDGKKEKASRENWSEHIMFKWSPEGSYLTTLHKQGVMLWAGPNFDKFQRFEHNFVNFIEFSPKETYLVTYASPDFYRNAPHVDNTLRIFDTFTGELKKTFTPTRHGRLNDWPFFKWSADEKYFGFSRHGQIHVYETENFELLNKASIGMDGLITFEWNPAKNLLSYYCEERVNASAPAEIGVMEIPSKQVKRAARIYNVSTANLFWQKAGNYLAAHTERYNSRKIKDGEVKLSGIVSHLEIFDCSQQEVSVQTIKLPESFISFGWDPKAEKFCVLVGSVNKVTPMVYKIDPGKTEPKLISQIEAGLQLNTVSFAPQGGWLSVYASGSTSGHVIFIDTNGAEAKKVRVVEHSSMNYGAWDPTGRYFVTCAVGHHRLENGYRIHTFQGRELSRRVIDGLSRFKWRPRPPSKLTEQQMREIRKRLKETSKKFEEEDRKEQAKASEELIEKRRKIMEQFDLVRNANRKQYESEENERQNLRHEIKASEADYIEETITIPLNTEVKPLETQEAAE